MNKTFVSDLSGKRFSLTDRVSGEAVRTSIMEIMQADKPDFDASKYLSIRELNDYREKYISKYLKEEVGDITELDRKVLEAIRQRSLVTDGPDGDRQPTVGEKVADKVASFGGSWKFIIIFVVFLLLWVAINGIWLANRAFDPYPFILMNLILSCLAALQAPVIMMSQNRQSDKDREHARSDYMVNLKSELEVRALHEKIDHLMLYQMQELIEVQKIQIEMLTSLQKSLRSASHKVEKELKG